MRYLPYTDYALCVYCNGQPVGHIVAVHRDSLLGADGRTLNFKTSGAHGGQCASKGHVYGYISS